jgi:hypothetical protein
VTYGLIETHIDGQAGFVPVAQVIVGKPNLHDVWGVATDLPLDDLLLDFCQNGDNYATSCVGTANTADYDTFALHSTMTR